MPKSKLEQVNASYKRALAQILVRELPDRVELTVSDVLIDPSYQHGRVWLRTTPEILAEVNAKRSDILTKLTNYVKTRYTPKLTFLIDDGQTDQLDALFEKIKDAD